MHNLLCVYSGCKNPLSWERMKKCLEKALNTILKSIKPSVISRLDLTRIYKCGAFKQSLIVFFFRCHVMCPSPSPLPSVSLICLCTPFHVPAMTAQYISTPLGFMIHTKMPTTQHRQPVHCRPSPCSVFPRPDALVMGRRIPFLMHLDSV